MTQQPPVSERLLRARADVSVLAGTTSERQVRPLRDALERAEAPGAEAERLLDTVGAVTALLERAEAQVSGLERSVREDLERASTLSGVRTAAQLASAADVATACAAARALLLDVDEARAQGARHDPASVLVLLLDADAALDAVVSGYRDARSQADRQLLLFEAARTAARLGTEAVSLLAAVHGERVSATPRILAEETGERLESAAATAATDPPAALHLVRAAADRGRSALDEALVDLDGAGAPSAAVPAASAALGDLSGAVPAV